jgi:hypothetical protein
MVKRDFLPIRFIVAIRTFCADTLVVNIVVTMAADTVARGITMFICGFMAVGTLCFNMFATQLKVGEKVIEC